MLKRHFLTAAIGLGSVMLIALIFSVQLANAGGSNYPSDPLSDRAYVDGVNFYTRPVSDLEANFNAARAAETAGLGIPALPSISFPSQADWDAMDDDEQALFIINAEREARGVLPLTGSYDPLNDLATQFATYLGANQLWGHDFDWNNDNVIEDPWDRIAALPVISGCRDFLGVSENLSVMVSSSQSFPNAEPVAVSIYGWLYDDAGSAWGHRHALLWSSFTNNAGSADDEGLFGIGVWSGGPYQGPFSQPWEQVEMIVFNVFDPCSSWEFSAPTSAELTQTSTHHAPSPILLITLLIPPTALLVTRRPQTRS